MPWVSAMVARSTTPNPCTIAMAYDIKPVRAPRLAGRSLRAFANWIERAEAGRAARATLLSHLGLRELRAADPGVTVTVFDHAEDAAKGAQGLVNCTPLGMHGHPGTPLDARAMSGAQWAFDAVYTPADTLFLKDAEAAGLTRGAPGYMYFI